MPELPEVETIRRELDGWIRGRRIIDAGSHPSAKFTPAVEVVGATMVEVDRRGKYLLFDTDFDVELVAHLGMTGTFVPEPSMDTPHLRAWWRFDDGASLGFRDIRRFGRLRVVPRGDYRSIATLHRLGPEPLGPEFTPAQLHQALGRSSRPIKTQLLSQRPVAGVGNIYADEALWLAQVAPTRRRISLARAGQLHEAVRTVITQAVDNGGTTLRDYRTMSGDRGDNQTHLKCYGRAGEPCVRCGELLTSRVIDARTTTWCQACQR